MKSVARPGVLIPILAWPFVFGCTAATDGDAVTDVIAPIAAMVESNIPPDGDPVDWACKETLEPASPEAIATFCSTHPRNRPEAGLYPRGKPYVPPVPPATLSDLENKNKFDLAFGEFMDNDSYARSIDDGGLGWIHDTTWRFTGPIVGELCTYIDGDGNVSGCSSDVKKGYIDSDDFETYGVHPAVRVYYSPEIIDWLCDGRQGQIADNGVIIKQMAGFDGLPVSVDAQGCMTIDQAPQTTGYATWIRDNKTALDGWYWIGNVDEGNPPIWNASAATKKDFDVPTPTVPNPKWYPTGNAAEFPNVVYPYNGYAPYCLNCHASAATNLTFASLDNVVGNGIQYKLYPKPRARSLAPVPDAGSIHDLTTLRTPEQAKSESRAPYATPLGKPDTEFLNFYNQIPAVSFQQAWDLRLPAETFDHVFSGPGGPGQFLTSDQCIGCHDATNSNSVTANMLFAKDGGDYEYVNLSPYATWRVSPMGLAGRDPIFFSQLQSETNNLPELAECLENTCLHCHGVMGQRQLALDTKGGDQCKSLFAVPPPPEVPFGEPFRLSMVTKYQDSPHAGDDDPTRGSAMYGNLARDGISCAVCHHIADSPALDTEANYTGNFVTGPADEVYGPYADRTIVPKPMQHAIGITPKYGEQIQDSSLCSTCHNILLPEITNDGRQVGASYEQTTGFEWQNSDFAKPGTFQSCQDCHMRTEYKGQQLQSKIANIESSDFAPTTERLPDNDIKLTERDRFPRHTLAGLNVFINEMFQQFPLLLGLRQTDYMTAGNVEPALIHGRNAIIEIAEQATAAVTIDSLEKTPDGKLKAVVTVTNKAGHYLPSGVGFRRVFIDFRVKKQNGDDLWSSGKTDTLGVIVDGNNKRLKSEMPIANPRAYQRHYTRITATDQVQIYEEKIKDSDGDFTTSFVRRIQHVKDNRLRPKGYDPAFFERSDSPYIKELANTYGDAATDQYYTDPTLTGADKIEYLISLDSGLMDEVDHVRVSLYNQSIPPGYLQERFRDATRGPQKQNEIQRLYYLTSHLNVEAQGEDEKPFISNWKLRLACGVRALAGPQKVCQPENL